MAKPGEYLVHRAMRKQANIEVGKHSDTSNPFYVDAIIVQQESDGTSAPKVKLKKSEDIDCCKDLEGKFVSRNHIFRKGTSRKLRVYANSRKRENSQGGESTPSVYSFAMDTNVFFVILPFFS